MKHPTLKLGRWISLSTFTRSAPMNAEDWITFKARFGMFARMSFAMDALEAQTSWKRNINWIFLIHKKHICVKININKPKYIYIYIYISIIILFFIFFQMYIFDQKWDGSWARKTGWVMMNVMQRNLLLMVCMVETLCYFLSTWFPKIAFDRCGLCVYAHRAVLCAVKKPRKFHPTWPFLDLGDMVNWAEVGIFFQTSLENSCSHLEFKNLSFWIGTKPTGTIWAMKRTDFQTLERIPIASSYGTTASPSAMALKTNPTVAGLSA